MTNDICSYIQTYVHTYIHTYICSGTCVPLGSLPRKHRRVAARSSPHYRRVGGEKIAPGYQPGWCGPAVPLERGPERGSILQSTDEWLQELRPLRRPAANGVPCRVLGLVSQGSHTSRFSCLRWRVRSTALLRYGSVSLRSLIAFSRLPSGVSKVVPTNQPNKTKSNIGAGMFFIEIHHFHNFFKFKIDISAIF